MAPPHLSLRPEADIAVGPDGEFTATTAEPWLSCEKFDGKWRGAFLEIAYRASLLDEPARPLFRFWQDNGTWIDRIGIAPLVGSGSWIGRVPPRTMSLSVSPTNRVGRFDFALEGVRRASWFALIISAFRRSPKYGWRAFLLQLVGFRAEADAMLSWAIGSRALSNYPSWKKEYSRPFQLDGIDRPRCEWGRTTIVCVLLGGEDPAARSCSCESLQEQVFQTWSAIVVGPTDVCHSDSRFVSLGFSELIDEAKQWPADALICVLKAGDVLLEHAFAYVSEQAERHPHDQLFYGDVLEIGRNSESSPLLLPGWSPRFWLERPFLQRPVFIRAGFLMSKGSCQNFLSRAAISAELVSTSVRPLRRIFAALPCDVPDDGQIEVPPPARGPEQTFAKKPTATVIIPTRGSAALLTPLLKSMRGGECSIGLQLIIMNNGGSRDVISAAAKRAAPNVSVEIIDYDDDFNFSAICNAGAAASRGDVLVFLNDDMEVLTDDWLQRLISYALMPDVGAVGAKLTYPNGRLQHVGIVVGWGEGAGHFDAQAEGTASGWGRRNKFVHEVSAVTGSCLAVERSKFEAVGGFDEKSFPIELGDVDLCLKLFDRGWPALFHPSVCLTHAESKSRGPATFRRLAVHASEHAAFYRRWRHILRDDPFFHPGLSLYSWRAALG